MKISESFNRAVDRFCMRHPRFGIPRLMMYIVIGNAAVFLLSMMDTTGALVYYLYLSPQFILRGQIWRLITFIFVPQSGNILLLALFLYFYYFIGSSLEREWGSGKFTVYYLCGMLLTVIYTFLAALIYRNAIIFSGAGYINLSMFFAFATFYPENRVLLFFVIPVKVKWLAYADAAFFLISMITERTLLPLVGVLNYLLFCGYMLKPFFSRLKWRSSPDVINFRRTVRDAKRETENASYRHKCAVCGRTDTDWPDLEFRYCSRCAGYHCFCIDHINNHVHFTE
ncbi:MAG: rhomboid family intramembrane serine protease [Oscillospiraceae bacterium]|jgi:membrane associated rhomboid family serine protease|nr:rhomboid family intramembrane serine protease [Oscillospiraceae bacterium]